MECLLQYWDDLDDLIGIVGLFAERLRRAALFALGTAFFFALVGVGVMLALHRPPLALALVTVLLVVLMNLSVTVSFTRQPAA